MTLRRVAMHAAFAVLGATIASVVMFAVSGWGRPVPGGLPRGRPPASDHASAPAPPATSEPEGDPRQVMLAWSPAGLPEGIARTLDRVPGVGRTTVVRAGLDWIDEVRASDGTLLDRGRGGFRIPFEVAAIRPASYARFVPVSERASIRALRGRRVLLARTSAQLRSADVGATIRIAGTRLIVSGIVSDVATNGYEALIAQPPPRRWQRVDGFILAHAGPAARRRFEGRLRSSSEGRPFRTRLAGEQPFLRYGDAVHPQMVIKHHFGEFKARPLPDGRIEVDPRWREESIRTARIPLLGAVTCHRALLPQVRGAFSEIKRRGLGPLVEGYAGCYSPRFISRDPSGRLSHHAWGIAIDINPASNTFGTEPNMPPRLVSILESWGYTWGGRWIIPDGMHFEWSRFP